MRLTRVRRRLTARASVLTTLVAVLMLAAASPAFAIQSKNGSKNCGAYLAGAHANYLGGLALTPPGGTTGNYFSASWTTQVRIGSKYGNWVASADYLDLGDTFAYCTTIS